MDEWMTEVMLLVPEGEIVKMRQLAGEEHYEAYDVDGVLQGLFGLAGEVLWVKEGGDLDGYMEVDNVGD